jgi:hypothetical protein
VFTHAATKTTVPSSSRVPAMLRCCGWAGTSRTHATLRHCWQIAQRCAGVTVWVWVLNPTPKSLQPSSEVSLVILIPKKDVGSPSPCHCATQHRGMPCVLCFATQVIILDIRYPSVPITQLARHHSCVNALAWAPHSASHLCTAGDDAQVWPAQPNLTSIRALLLNHSVCFLMTCAHPFNSSTQSNDAVSV